MARGLGIRQEGMGCGEGHRSPMLGPPPSWVWKFLSGSLTGGVQDSVVISSLESKENEAQRKHGAYLKAHRANHDFCGLVASQTISCFVKASR